MAVEVTRDYETVNRILRTPKIYRSLRNDFWCPVEQFQANESPTVTYLLARLDTGDHMGLYMLHPVVSPLLWEIHHAILPHFLVYSDAIRNAVEDWLWSHTPAQSAIGFTPTSNSLACRYAERNGMVPLGTIPNVWPKDGKLYGLNVYLKTRPAPYDIM